MSGKRRYFGTDGVRGVFGEDITEELVERLGRAFALWNGGGDVVVGRDTRASGPALEAALARGLASGAAEVHVAGVVPTPAVALADRDAGAVVSASHNPPEYNGVKFFHEHLKLTDDEEEAIEARMSDAGVPGGLVAEEVGLRERYVEYVTEQFGGPLGGLRVALDCAHGAMYEVAPTAFERLGADLVVVGNEPNGANINEGCGATDLSLLSRVAREREVDLGIAFDGDGDRMLAVDAEGNELDGDEILAILALHLGVDLVAVTQMTNLGFHRLMGDRGIRVVTTDVGDRYVLEALRREEGVLGGEQSGHLIYLRGHTTGDGLAAALLLCRAVVEQEQPLSTLATVMTKYPQAKANVVVERKELPESLLAEIERVGAGLGEEGRVLVRPSGTEPVVRVLAEAETPQIAGDLCARIVTLVQRELG
jgi:phosphoglucosamine mutase